MRTNENQKKEFPKKERKGNSPSRQGNRNNKRQGDTKKDFRSNDEEDFSKSRTRKPKIEKRKFEKPDKDFDRKKTFNKEEKDDFKKSKFKRDNDRKKFGSDDKKPGFKKKFGTDDKKPGFKKKFGTDDKKPGFKKKFGSKPYRDDDKKHRDDDRKPFRPKKDYSHSSYNDEENTTKRESENKHFKVEPSTERETRKVKFIPKDADSSEERSYSKRDKKHEKFQQELQDKYENEYNSSKHKRKRTYKSKKSNVPQDEFQISESTRLNKYLANAGICSRREADEYIRSGIVRVNGVIVTELGTKVKPGDVVKFHDEPVSLEKKVYILLNKPKDYITTTDDPHADKTVIDLIEGACQERVYPVGRLDRNTTGVLLLTNDGDLAKKLTHPKYNKKKIYHVFLDKNLKSSDMEKILSGIDTEVGFVLPDSVSYVDPEDKTQIGIEIHTGQNRIVRRIFEALGYRIEKLDRVYFAGLTKKNLTRGKWRFLTEKEINLLKMGAFE